MSSDSADNWDDCRPGDLVAIGRRVRSAERRRVLQLMLMSVVLAAGALFAVVGDSEDDGHMISGVTCREVEAELRQYADRALSTERQARFAAHIKRCPRCRTKLSELQSSSASVHHDCPHCRLVSFAGPSH